jgi:hypothetical protein
MAITKIDFENVIKSIAGGPAPFTKTFEGRSLKGITCPKSVDKLPPITLDIGDYTYNIAPRSYAFMEYDEVTKKKYCYFMIYQHEDPSFVYNLLPENYLKGVKIIHDLAGKWMGFTKQAEKITNDFLYVVVIILIFIMIGTLVVLIVKYIQAKEHVDEIKRQPLNQIRYINPSTLGEESKGE